MKKKFIALKGLITLVILVSGSAIQAQDSTRISPFHFSLVTPLGTNGLASWNTTNLVSVNLFAGYSGGLKGVEVAGFANALKEDMNGIQVAGFCNNTIGKANGLEIAGFWNFNRLRMYGLQAAGFANVALDTVIGVQAAGFTNITTGDTRGVQASGFANVTTGMLAGVQASGFFNYARKVRGVQVGVVNVADTVETGAPIGVFSFVRHGYKVIQVGGNETLFGEISLKTGVSRFYNIFSIGATAWNGNLKWGWGYGIGTLIPLAKRMDLSLEGISYHINEDSWFTDYLNSLNRLNLSLSYNLTGRIGVYAGASWNVRVTRYGTHEGWQVGHGIVSMYPGLMAGLRLGL